jgi:hypothetical protein
MDCTSALLAYPLKDILCRDSFHLSRLGQEIIAAKITEAMTESLRDGRRSSSCNLAAPAIDSEMASPIAFVA